MQEINVQLLNMDTMIPEQLVKNADDSYTIFLNARLSQDGQLKAYEHALKHIENGDFEKSDVQSIEFQAHELEASTVPLPAPMPASEFEKQIKQIQKKRKKIRKALAEKEREVNAAIDFCGPEYCFKVAENQWLYGGIE